ncbi:unnamed protein product, partial [Meganyctiphanes norvegica]
KMCRAVFIVILMGQLSHQQQQQDLCGQTILQHLAHIMEARFTQLDIRINELASRQDINMDTRFTQLDIKINEIASRQDINMDTRFTQLDIKINEIASRQDINMDTRFTQLDIKISE